MLENLDKVLAELAGKLNVATPFIWQALEKQVKVALTMNIIGIILCIIGAFVFYKLTRFLLKKYAESGGSYLDRNDFYQLVAVFTGLIGIICLIGIKILIFQLIQLVMNPDYYILKNLLENLMPK